MRILVLIHEFPPIGGGGGRVADNIAHLLVERGHEVHVLAPHIHGLPILGSLAGISITRIPSFRRYFFQADMPAMLGYIVVGFFVGLWKIWRFRPDLIHVHFAVPAGALAWLLHFLTGIPYVLTSHLGDVPGGVPEKTQKWFRWIKPFTPRIWKDAAVVTAISDYTRELAQTQYPVDIKLIHNGVRSDTLHTVNIRLNSPPQIIFAGRFVPQKNPNLIPLILNEIKDLNWHCIMIGDGSLRKETKEHAISFGLSDRIVFPGWLVPQQVSGMLKQSDILLLPSRSEGIPMIGLESLAAGLVVIASGVGGISDLIINEKNGILCVVGNIQGYATALRTFLSQPDKLLNGRKASFDLSKQFDLMKIVDEYEEVFLNVLKRKRK